MNRSPRGPKESPANRGFHGDGGNRTHGLFPPSPEPCVIWEGACNSKGYGVRTVDSRRWLAHRYAYVQAYGPLTPGAQVHHACRNRLCVNPAHLEAVSATEHRRTHMDAPSAVQVVEDALRERGVATRRVLVQIGSELGVSEIAITTALSRMPNVKRVARGIYRLTLEEAA